MRARRSATAIAAFSAGLGAAILVAAPPPADPPPPPVATATGSVPVPAPAESADAFYLSRMTIGQQALAAGHAAEAADNLRVASFGLLGDPAKLTECLVWLSVAEQRAGRGADVDATLRRFQQVQALFPSYAGLSISAGLRSEFEALVRKRDPGLVLERPREAQGRVAPPAPAASPPPPSPAPAPSAGPALAASLRPAPDSPKLRSPVPPLPMAPSEASSPPAPPPGRAPVESARGPFDQEIRTAHAAVFEIRPDQARLFVDGRYVGISADWGRTVGRPFPLASGEHLVRVVLPGYRELRMRVIADSSAPANSVAAAELVQREHRSFRRMPRPDDVTAGPVAFGPELAGVNVAVDGEATGSADRFPVSAPMRLSGPAVHDLVLSRPGRPARTIRVLASPTAGDELVVVRTAL